MKYLFNTISGGSYKPITKNNITSIFIRSKRIRIPNSQIGLLAGSYVKYSLG